MSGKVVVMPGMLNREDVLKAIDVLETVSKVYAMRWQSMETCASRDEANSEFKKRHSILITREILETFVMTEGGAR